MSQQTAQIGRREVIAGLTTVGGMLSTLNTAQAQSTDTDAIIRLLNRITYGPKSTEFSEAKSLGFTAYLEKQLNMPESEDSASETTAQQRYPRGYQSLFELANLDNDWITGTQLQDLTLHRMLNSKRQLYTKMCEFWRDHFNIYLWKVGGWMMVDDQNNVIRKFALGKFPDMLNASARSGAMSQYLDNAYSHQWNPNQNYAREIMELHTLSSTGGYTQTDVEEVTRCFTAWSFTFPWEGGPNVGKYRYRQDWHDTGAKVVLGRNFPAGRQAVDGASVISILATHPNTAKFISKKLIHYFLGEGNWASLETAVATVYKNTGGDIKAMLRAILTPANLNASAPRLKRPNHLFISGLRQINAAVRNFENMRWSYVNQAGQELFAWSTPDGYPDKDAYWMGFMLPRWNFFMGVLSGYMGSAVTYNIDTNFPGTNAPLVVDKVNSRLFLGKMPSAERDKLKTFLASGAMNSDRRREGVVLGLCSPSYQWF